MRMTPVSDLLQKWSISTLIRYSCRDIANWGTILLIVSSECWIKSKWMNYKNNNFYKTERAETIHILVFTIKNLKSAKTYKSRRVLLSLKQLILASANSYCKFHIFVIYNVLYFSLWTSTLYFLCFPFFFIDRLSMFSFPFCWSHLKAETAHSVNSSLFRKRWNIGQLNVTAETADNEEQYTLSKIIYIEFQDSYSFLWSFLW